MEDKYKSTLGVKNLPNRLSQLKNPDAWLDDKRAIDGAEGLWRVYDNLYDVTDFIKRHPGGTFWLEATKGTDITEAYESHHITTLPDDVLKKYFVRKAKIPRHSPFTFEENGFYKTLKRNVREALKTVPKNSHKSTEMLTDGMLIGSFVFSVLSCIFWSYTFAVISGFLLTCTAVAAHNYGHQKDSFRVYYSDVTMVSSRDFRILHVLSHHMFTNSVADLQAYNFEPIVNFFPHSKSLLVRYGSWLYVPLIFWPTSFFFMFGTKIYQGIFVGLDSIKKADFLAFLVPLVMYLFGGQPFIFTVAMWIFTMLCHGFCFGIIATTTTHFHPEIFVDGDKARADRDWGINQLDTVSDRYEVTGNLFLSLITFGDHALHHLFPTLDHGVLQHLYPVAEKTMKEFNLNIRMTSQLDMFGGYFRQLARTKPNPNPPNLFTKKEFKYY